MSQQVTRPDRDTGLFTLSSGQSIDLSRLSFTQHKPTEPNHTAHLRISGPYREFEQDDYLAVAGQDQSYGQGGDHDLLVNCVSSFTSRGRVWTTVKAKLYGFGLGMGIGQDVPNDMSRTGMDSNQSETRGKRYSDVSTISAELPCYQAISVALKMVVIDDDDDDDDLSLDTTGFLANGNGNNNDISLHSINGIRSSSRTRTRTRNPFVLKTAVHREIEAYAGPLLPLQGKYVPRCYGVFSAPLAMEVQGQVEKKVGGDQTQPHVYVRVRAKHGRQRCWIMLLDWLDELEIESWDSMDDETRSVQVGVGVGRGVGVCLFRFHLLYLHSIPCLPLQS